MPELVDTLRPTIERTISKLQQKRFTVDPIAGDHYSKVTSVLSSAYKRHGFIIEQAILHQLKKCPNFEVWDEKAFQVPDTADHMVDTALKDLSKIKGAQAPYHTGSRTLQVDAVVFNEANKTISAYEIKRGSGLHDSGKRRSILRDLLCVQILLKSYAESKGYKISSAHSYIIFYYGKCSIQKPFSLTAQELDEHFGWAVRDAVEQVNDEFRQRLLELLENA